MSKKDFNLKLIHTKKGDKNLSPFFTLLLLRKSLTLVKYPHAVGAT